jgi:hypothetical protein
MVVGWGRDDVQKALSVHHSGWRLETMIEEPLKAELLNRRWLVAGGQP